MIIESSVKTPALRSISASFSLLYCFYSLQLQCILYLFSTKQQTDTDRDELLNIVEKLAAKELDIFSQEVMETKTDQRRIVDIGLTFIWWTQTLLYMNHKNDL